MNKETKNELKKISEALAYFEEKYINAKDVRSKKIWLKYINQTKEEHRLFYIKNANS